MGSASEIFAPASNKAPLAIEDNHRIATLARGINGVMDINVPVRVLTNTMCIAVLDVGRQLAPVVSYFEDIFTGTDSRLAHTCFTRRAQDQWRARAYRE